MAIQTHRTVRELLIHARQALGMTQKQFGMALGASHRTASRWEGGQSYPYGSELTELAALVYPKDASLAAELAAAKGQTLESLGIVAPPAPAPAAPPPPPLPVRLLVDSVVCAAADALETAPVTLRVALLAAFRRARELRLSIDDVESALAPAATPAGAKPAKAPAKGKA